MEKPKQMRTGPELIRATKPFAQEHRGRSWWHFGSTLAALIGLLGMACLDMPWFLRLPFSVLAAVLLPVNVSVRVPLVPLTAIAPVTFSAPVPDESIVPLPLRVKPRSIVAAAPV